MPYSNDISHSEYLKYAAAAAANNGYYGGSGPVYFPGPNGWIPRIPPQVHGISISYFTLRKHLCKGIEKNQKIH